MKDFLKKINTPGADPVAESVEILPGTLPGGKPKARLAGVAVFRRDRLAGWLDEKETRGFLWVVGKARTGMICTGCSGRQGKNHFPFFARPAQTYT